jgi:hypothetical protein
LTPEQTRIQRDLLELVSAGAAEVYLFLLRRLEKVGAEWTLACLAFNLKKIHRITSSKNQTEGTGFCYPVGIWARILGLAPMQTSAFASTAS